LLYEFPVLVMGMVWPADQCAYLHGLLAAEIKP